MVMRFNRIQALLMVVLCGGGCVTATAAVYNGITEPFHDAYLSAAVSGRIAGIHHREGAVVETGALLVSLDHRMEELEVARRRLIMESTVEQEAARDQVAVLAENLEATRRLAESTRSVSREQLAQLELEHRMAVAEMRRVEENKQREAIEYEMAVEQLARRQIRAPFPGILTEVLLDLGEACEPREPVLRLVDLHRAYFIANVASGPEDGLLVGAPVELRIGEDAVAGTVEFVAPVVDPASGLRRVKVVFNNPDGRIAPGSVGQMLLMEAESDGN
jgi:RND family efflux transporter MFP subunit